MTTAAKRTKLHAYIDEADGKTLDVVYRFLETQRKHQGSLLTEGQQKEVQERSAAYKEGTAKGYTLEEARAILQKKKAQ